MVKKKTKLFLSILFRHALGSREQFARRFFSFYLLEQLIFFLFSLQSVFLRIRLERCITLLGHIFSFLNVPIASNDRKISSHTQSYLLIEYGRFLVMHTQTSLFSRSTTCFSLAALILKILFDDLLHLRIN